ncbi:19308_t:CDS:2, partial [Funneliformis geosporum]
KRDEENLNLNGGGELQISINRKDLEQYSTGDFKRGRKKGVISVFDDHRVGFTPISDSNSYLVNKETYSPSKDNKQSPTSPNAGGTEKTSNNKNIQLKDSEKKEIISYFLAQNISRISLESGQLIIEYKDHTKKVIENEDQQLQKYHQIIQTLPNQSISLSDLQNNTNNLSTPNQNNPAIYVSLALGAFVLGGVL